MSGTSNCCWQSKDFPGIVGEPTLQHEFVSQLQKCRQSTSRRHLWENLRDPERDESTSDVMWKFASTVWRLGARGAWPSQQERPLRGECRARIEQKMPEDVTEEAMRLEEAIRRKRARPDDESGREDVAMEVAARNPIRPVQHGGSSSSWKVRPEPSRRREAEEQLGGDVVRARLQDPWGVVRIAEEVRLQPREELEAAVDSICKHVKELGALHVAESDVGEIFLPGRSAELGSAFSELPGAVVDLWC